MGNEARTIISLGLTKEEYGDKLHATLYLTTDKHDSSKRIVSQAMVYWCGPMTKQHAFGFGAPGGDFSRTIYRTEPGARATQKAVDGQHAQVFTPEKVAELTAAALAHYPNATRADAA